MKRRQFLKTAVAAAAAIVVPIAPAAPAPLHVGPGINSEHPLAKGLVYARLGDHWNCRCTLVWSRTLSDDEVRRLCGPEKLRLA